MKKVDDTSAVRNQHKSIQEEAFSTDGAVKYTAKLQKDHGKEKLRAKEVVYPFPRLCNPLKSRMKTMPTAVDYLWKAGVNFLPNTKKPKNETVTGNRWSGFMLNQWVVWISMGTEWR